METLMTAQEVAAVLRVSPRKFEQMVADGIAPPCYRFGRLRRWSADELDTWLADRLREDAAAQMNEDEKED